MDGERSVYKVLTSDSTLAGAAYGDAADQRSREAAAQQAASTPLWGVRPRLRAARCSCITNVTSCI